MKPPESSPRSFGSFLDAVQGSQEQAPASGQVSVNLLRHLTGGPLQVQDLMQRSGIPLIDFAEALKQMRQAELVHVRSSALGDQVGLTDIGAKVMSLGEQAGLANMGARVKSRQGDESGRVVSG